MSTAAAARGLSITTDSVSSRHSASPSIPWRASASPHPFDEPFVVELGAREVDRHVEVLEPRRLVAPRRQLAQGLFEHPFPDPDDEPALLGQRDELDGRDDPQGGVGPPDERLDPFDGPVGDADDGLVHEVQLAQLDRPAQVVLELDALGHLGPHRLVEHGHGVASGVLGLVHGGVGVADEDLGLVSGSSPDANAKPMLADT